MRARRWVSVAAITQLLVTGCGGERNYAEDLKQPPTSGVATAGPGSGKVLAAHLHYTMQKNNPQTKFSGPSCPDVADSRPGATVTCTMAVDGDQQQYSLRMDDDGLWQISQPE